MSSSNTTVGGPVTGPTHRTDRGPGSESAHGDHRSVLVLPAGWVIDRSAEIRLGRQLARAGADVSAVSATARELPPGTSYRTYAERRAMRPMSSVEELPSRRVRGAVLVRPGVGFELQDQDVVVERGVLLADHGAHAHDPWRPVAPLRLAGVESRPPFAWRPVVVFLACESGGPHHGEELLGLINDLQGEDVESRLAALDVAEGHRLLLQPCLAHPDSMRSLLPDVIVALDATALDRSDAWCGSHRGTTMIEFSPDTTGLQLVSWQIGHASGRRRARIGLGVGASELARVVRRLSAGPHPEPPLVGHNETSVIRTWAGPTTIHVRPRQKRRSVLLLTGGMQDAAGSRFEGLRDQADDTTATIDLVSSDQGLPSRARAVDLVILDGVAPTTAVLELIRIRRAAGRPTAVELGAASTEQQSAESTPTLTADADALLRSCGLAILPTAGYREVVRYRDARTLVMPTLLTRERMDTLARVRGEHRSTATLVIGWRRHPSSPSRSAEHEIIAEALRSVLTDRPDVLVDLADASLPKVGPLADLPRVRLVRGQIRPRTLHRWVVQLWAPSAEDLTMSGDIGPLLEAAHVGVPTVLSSKIAAVTATGSSGAVVVKEPKEAAAWAGAIRSVLDGERHREARSEEVMHRSDELSAPGITALTIDRLLGWASYDGSDRS